MTHCCAEPLPRPTLDRLRPRAALMTVESFLPLRARRGQRDDPSWDFLRLHPGVAPCGVTSGNHV